MSLLKESLCSCCGAKVDPRKAVEGVLECPYCRTFLTFPKPESKALPYLQAGEHDLDSRDFDRAYEAYAKAAELDPAEPEAYFGMALATFKVQYLKDEVRECLQPICYEVSTRKFTEDKNYIRALQLATSEQKEVYHARGEAIDSIREEFFELQKSGLDYDCFLCVKVTAPEGGHTADYERANDIYYHLKDSGYKPFFSEREMKGREGSAYEALILYALYTSECMLIVCSNEEYLQTKWVKNEYLRFLQMIKDEEKERDALTFVFYGKPIEKLPNGKKIQGIDLSRPDAYSRITNYVELHTPEARAWRHGLKSKYCTSCGAENPPAAKFCQSCGKTEFVESKEDALRIIMEQKLRAEYDEKMKTAREDALREEEEKRQAEEKKPWLASDYPTLENYNRGQFEIDGTTLVKFRQRELQGEVKIPRGVISIGEGAFEHIKKVTSVVIPDTVTSIGKGAFYECGKLKKITVADSLTSLGESAFFGCIALTGVTIPNGVKKIGRWAFFGCSGLTSIAIPESVASIGAGAFAFGSKLAPGVSGEAASFSVSKDNPVYYSENNCIIHRKSKALIAGCNASVIPDGVTSIEEDAFSGCSGLSSIAIPDSVTTIGENAFKGCSGLASITVPDGVTSIGDQAFAFCRELLSIVIPRSVTFVGSQAFEGCQNLTIYCRHKKGYFRLSPRGWHVNWNPGYRPVKWDYKG